MGKINQVAALVPATAGVPPAYDRANFVIESTFAAVGNGQPFFCDGPFNFVIWGTATTTLTVASAGAATATVASATGLVNGQSINSTRVPPGTTFTISGTTVTFKLPPGFTSADILAGADAAATFMPVAWDAIIALERSFDGGSTWLVVGIGGVGVGAVYDGTAQDTTPYPIPVSVVVGEPELGMLYRANCPTYNSGTIHYRISGTGAAASGWAFSSLT